MAFKIKIQFKTDASNKKIQKKKYNKMHKTPVDSDYLSLSVYIPSHTPMRFTKATTPPSHSKPSPAQTYFDTLPKPDINNGRRKGRGMKIYIMGEQVVHSG